MRMHVYLQLLLVRHASMEGVIRIQGRTVSEVMVEVMANSRLTSKLFVESLEFTFIHPTVCE